MSVQRRKIKTLISELPATSETLLDHHVLAAARARIDAAATVLTGFHLRHKNQHHVSTYWWPALGQLRRHVRRMTHDLEVADMAANVTPRTTLTRRKQQGGARSDRNPEALVLARARWVRVHFVPKAYVAFSRLMADRQFAPLGLLLMGVLAQVQSVLHGLDAVTVDVLVDKKDTTENIIEANRDNSEGSESDGDDGRVPFKRLRPREPMNGGRDSNNAYASARPATDLGVAVAREEEEGGGPTPATVQASGGSDNMARPVIKQPRRGVNEGEKAGDRLPSTPAVSEKTKKGERSARDKVNVLTAEMAESASGVSKKSERKERKGEKEKEKKVKAKKRKRDEFDDLFSGLL